MFGLLFPFTLRVEAQKQFGFTKSNEQQI